MAAEGIGQALGEEGRERGRAVDEGRLRAGEGGPVVLAFVLWSALHGLVATRVAKPNMPGPPADLLVEAILEAFLHGVATEPA